MTNTDTKIINVRCYQHKDMYVATCSSLKGLFMFNPSYDTLKAILPESIALLYRANGEDVIVVPVHHDNDEPIPTSELNFYAYKKAA